MEINSLQGVSQVMLSAGITVHASPDEVRDFAEAIYHFLYDIEIEDLIECLKENVYGTTKGD